MRFLFEIVFSIKPKFRHVFIFEDFGSFGMGSGFSFGGCPG